jgi:hypothetical protein
MIDRSVFARNQASSFTRTVLTWSGGLPIHSVASMRVAGACRVAATRSVDDDCGGLQRGLYHR